MTDEELWAGIYGVQYTTRFTVEWRQRIPLMRAMLDRTKARSVLDVGTNAGWNLRALRDVDATLRLKGVEINPHVALTASSMAFDVTVGPARQVGQLFPQQFDLVITSGVLIHVPPDLIEETMRSIVQASCGWVLCIEYQAETEKAVRMHGDTPRAWARPYGDLYQSLGLGLAWHGIPDDAYPECAFWLMFK